MDNTYPRNLYCDEQNHVLNLDIHAGLDDYATDQSALYPSIAECLRAIYILFKDLELFPSAGVVNLDKYSHRPFRKSFCKYFFRTSMTSLSHAFSLMPHLQLVLFASLPRLSFSSSARSSLHCPHEQLD